MIEKINRNFKEDLDRSNDPTLRLSWEKLILKKFGEKSIITWKDDVDVQKGLGTDVVIKTESGRRYSVELKTRNHNCYKNDLWIMEIVHHVYEKEKEPRKHIYSKEGWIYSTTAEYIFHATLDESGKKIKEAIFYSLIPFKTNAYKSEFEKFDILWLSTVFENGNFQLTLNKLIPIDEIKSKTIEFWEWNNES